MKRRDIARALTGAATLLALPPGKPSSLPPATLPPFSALRLRSRLDVLRLAFEAKKQHVSPALQAGLSETQLRNRCSWFPSRLPDELVALYGWHDGQPLPAGEERYPFWFRDCGFTCIRNAEKEYESIMRTYGAKPPLQEFLKHSFPFAAFDGGWLVLPCKQRHPDSPYEHAVVSVMQGVDLWFYSMESMVETCIGWVTDPGYPNWANKALENEIWEKNNPGIFQRQNRTRW